MARFFRGLFSPYPDRFTNLGSLDLTRHGATWRPLWVHWWRRRWQLAGLVTWVYVRPRDHPDQVVSA